MILMNKKRIIIVGKGGSGKDHMRKDLQSMGFKYCVSHTSRPMRDGESEGVDYFFVDPEYFQKNPELFYESVIFNDWYYGTSIAEFRRSNLLIMTPSGIGKLTSQDRSESLIVYIDIPEDVRRGRLQKRGDSDSVHRRLSADFRDFDNFFDYDLSIKDPFFKCNFDWANPEMFKTI